MKISRGPGFFVLLMPLSLASGCGGDDSTPSNTCKYPIAGTCAGVPAGPLCDSATCTGGIACSSVASAVDAASLASAAMAAQPGSCIAVAPGSYPGVTLLGGVSLLGRGVDFVSIGGVTVSSGKGGTLRGITVTTHGIHLASGAQLHVDKARVTGSDAVGIALDDGASAEVTQSEVLGSGSYGVRATGSGSIKLSSSAIAESHGPGLWVQCASGCDCTMQPNATLSSDVLDSNALMGAAFVGAAVELHGVDIVRTQPYMLQAGGGLSISGCSTINATDLHVRESRAWGILIDGAAAKIGADDSTVEIAANHMGLWVQNLKSDGSQTVTLKGATVLENYGLGIGTSGEVHGFVIYGSQIRTTKMESVPVEGTGQQNVGDGLEWSQGAELTIKGLALGGNARQSVLIDGAVAMGSSIEDITLSDGDEAKGILEQRYDGTGPSPTVGPGAPAITTDPSLKFQLPLPPAAPTPP